MLHLLEEVIEGALLEPMLEAVPLGSQRDLEEVVVVEQEPS